ncbi:MAG: hypothetical protein M0R77_01075 [Gammaproteobacteria bacterium]|nr:hypothetical protein [Acholeplasmataceae bacterium]MCK9529148.1 hypothetical protein [Gammaproteobacteria bacterium]
MATNEDLYWHNQRKSKEAIERVTSNTAIGNISSGAARAFFGINHRQQPGLIPMNKDQIGYTFFTRPLMNMTMENLRIDRRLSLLLTKEPTSYSRYIRTVFDNNLISSNVDCPLLDNYQAFIPILTNFIQSSSGWPDAVAPTYTSPEGQYKEAFSFIDGPLNLNGTYDINCTFRNILGDPITDLFYYWILYAMLVFEDRLVPYPLYWWEHEIDYMTRIYRVTLDQNKRMVRSILSADAAFPLSSPMGQRGNFEVGQPFSRENDMINITFRTNGLTYNDPILFDEFNATVIFFNSAMRDDRREQVFRTIPDWALNLLNGYGYPRINPADGSFEWWVDKRLFYAVIPRDLAREVDPAGEAYWDNI